MTRATGTAEELEALRRRIDELETQLSVDDLTGIATKQRFFDYYKRHARTGDTVIFIDLDDFKSVNDTYGHTIGDRLLSEIANALARAAGSSGLIARLAGDEFIGLVQEHDESRVQEISAKLLASVNACRLPIGELLVTRAASINTTQVKLGMSARDALIEADNALRRAKETGKNRVVALEERGVQLSPRKPSVEDLHLGLDRGEIDYHVQPIFDLQDCALWGFEALLRWYRPSGEIIGPAQFLSTMTQAYSYGATPPLEAARKTAAWATLDQGKHIAFNISSAFLAKVANQKLDWIQTILGDIPAERAVFEIVETVVEQQSGSIAAVVKALRKRGVKVALDDFGIWQSTLSRLQTIPVDYRAIAFGAKPLLCGKNGAQEVLVPARPLELDRQ